MTERFDWLRAVDIATGLFVAVITLVITLAFWLWRERRSISVEIVKSHDDLSTEIGKLETDIEDLQTRVNQSATQADVARIYAEISQTRLSMARIEGQIGQQGERDRALTEQMVNLNERVAMISEALLRREKEH